MSIPMRAIGLVLLTCAALLLQGCFTLAATGIGATALAVDDRRPIGIQVEDENVEWKARKLQLENYKDAHVNFTSFNLHMLLTGEAPNEQMKKDIAESISKIPSVKQVTNELAVAGNSSVVARSGDTLTTASVKTRFIGNKVFAANHVKVVTEAGTVYLMGIVTKEEGDAAADIARNTAGVSRVVKVLEIVDQLAKR